MMLPTSTIAAQDNMSDWAEEEAARAAEYGILPDEAFKGDLTRPITREEFAWFSVYFLSEQYSMDIDDFLQMQFYIRESWPYKEIFSDVQPDDHYVNSAYVLGLVTGYGDGTFRPKGYISRQEAAVMLLNTYDFYGTWELQEKAFSFKDVFSDSGSVAYWANEPAMYMYQIGVLNGVGSNTFSPLGTYSVEQCILSFLRLYENAPESRFHGNITHFMTLDENIELALNIPWEGHVNDRFELEHYIVVQVTWGGLPHGESMTRVWIIYRDGGRREILKRLPPPDGNIAIWLGGSIKDLSVSDDESTLTFAQSRVYRTEENYDERVEYTAYFSLDLETAIVTVLE